MIKRAQDKRPQDRYNRINFLYLNATKLWVLLFEVLICFHCKLDQAINFAVYIKSTFCFICRYIKMEVLSKKRDCQSQINVKRIISSWVYTFVLHTSVLSAFYCCAILTTLKFWYFRVFELWIFKCLFMLQMFYQKYCILKIFARAQQVILLIPNSS